MSAAALACLPLPCSSVLQPFAVSYEIWAGLWNSHADPELSNTSPFGLVLFVPLSSGSLNSHALVVIILEFFFF